MLGYYCFAEYLAKKGLGYEEKALPEVHRVAEHLQYYLLKSSNELAKESEPCEKFHYTKYSQGILPIDTYKPEINDFANFKLELPWEDLRESIKRFGLMNSTLTAQMPSESSSVVSNTTNGIEPPRAFLSVKQSKKGTLKQILPGYNELKDNYTLCWDMKNNEIYLKMMAIIQKFFDQSISTNLYYNPEHYENNEIPLSVMMKDFYALKWALKLFIIIIHFDGKNEQNEPLWKNF